MIGWLTIAMAQAPQGGEGSPQSSMFLYVWIALMIALFYFMLIRPQKRREKERQALLSAVKTNDRVLFAGGLIGVVSNVKEQTLLIKVADNVKLEVVRGAVSQVLEKGAAIEGGATGA